MDENVLHQKSCNKPQLSQMVDYLQINWQKYENSTRCDKSEGKMSLKAFQKCFNCLF